MDRVTKPKHGSYPAAEKKDPRPEGDEPAHRTGPAPGKILVEKDPDARHLACPTFQCADGLSHGFFFRPGHDLKSLLQGRCVFFYLGYRFLPQKIPKLLRTFQPAVNHETGLIEGTENQPFYRIELVEIMFGRGLGIPVRI